MASLRATMRLQLHRHFTFADAQAWIPYFSALGISHLYLSPIAMATEASTHGYDVVDPTVINPELGGEQGFLNLSKALRAQGMGAILDIVPNHMAASLSNKWWSDVLAKGENSAYAKYFDIDWDDPACERKVCLPVLSESLQDAIDKQHVSVVRHGSGVGIRVGELIYPASEESAQALMANADNDAESAIHALNADTARLTAFVDRQHYRLIDWKAASCLNYRRFFDINGLIALSMHETEVFDAVHALPLRLIQQGHIDGLRVDHIDGLADPLAYLETLRRRMNACHRVDDEGRPIRLTIHVEKILADHECIPERWPVDGTTGYDFMHELNILFHHPAGYIKLLHAWTSVTGEVGDFPLVERSARQEIMDGSLKPDIRRCARAIYDAVRAMSLAAPENVDAGDVERALKEVLEHMSVYRTYLGWGDATEHDASVIEHAVKTARRSDDPTHDRIRELIRECLLTPPAQDGSEHRNATWRLARIRFEQLSSALEAKAVEDTGFYRFTPLLSLNEVGGKPQALSFQPQRFHQAMHARAERWPLSLSPLATHDHKRGADTRARLAVISERADGFAIGFDAWLQQLGTRSAPSRMALWGLYQTLLAAWPLKLEPTDNTGLAEFAKRIEQWFIKAEREAKRDTSWVKCNEVYEKACRDIVSDLLLSERCAPLRHAMHETARSLDAAGALIGMAMTTLQLTAPGVPDIYQGSEYWDLSLVDPDNRRAVDYHARQMSLDVDVSLDTLLADFRDDTLKQHLIYRLLQLRKAWPELFLCGNYEPLRVTGERADHIVGFTRRHNGRQLVVAVPRLCADAMENVTAPLPSVSFWGNTRVDIVNRDEACTFTDLFSHAKRGSDPEAWSAASLFSSWPLCVMISASGSDECEALFRRQATPYQ